MILLSGHNKLKPATACQDSLSVCSRYAEDAKVARIPCRLWVYVERLHIDTTADDLAHLLKTVGSPGKGWNCR